MRIIDADALKEHVFGKRGGLVHTSDIDDAPTIDAVPVVHGHWKGWTGTHWNKRYQDDGEPEYVEYTYYSCSECRRRTVIREKYCPNCGARMDGERREVDHGTANED